MSVELFRYMHIASYIGLPYFSCSTKTKLSRPTHLPNFTTVIPLLKSLFAVVPLLKLVFQKCYRFDHVKTIA